MIKSVKLNLGLTLAAVLVVGVLAVGSVSAENSGGSGGNTVKTDVHTGTTTTVKPVADSDSDTPTIATTETEHQTTTTPGVEPPTTRVSELRVRAAKQLAEDRLAKKTETKVEDRQKACQAREANLNNKIANYSKHAKKALTAYDATFDKLQAFQADKKLSVADYDTLVATANAKKATATEAVNALEAVSVNIDCTSTDPAASVATVKTAVKNARVALQDYRKSVKDVLVALMTAKRAATSTTPSTESTKETN